jgi:hypothetical protein
MASKLTQNLTEATVVDKTGDRVPIYSAASPSELRYMTPDNLVPDASTTVEGKVELLTDAETITGADTTRAMTASNLTAKMDTDGTLAGNSDTRIPSQKAVKTYGDRALNTLLTRIPLYAPQGFLINGKISVTDAAGITVAIKTLAGTNPSATDPVYVRIGDTVRTITAALSVSKADGTNWCNAGSSELATKEIDYFVYLGYNATDGVVLGFSRYPGANQYSDFSVTTTNEKYCAISTITTAASTDYYEVVGRFAATLSAGAGYTWSVPTYTAINLIQRPIYETRFLSAVGVYSGNGSMTYGTVTTSIYDYKITNNEIIVIHNHNGTVGGTLNTQIRFVLPFSAIGNNLTENQSIIGNNQKGYVYRKIDTSTKNLCVDESPSGNYTAGASFHFGTFSYKI